MEFSVFCLPINLEHFVEPFNLSTNVGAPSRQSHFQRNQLMGLAEIVGYKASNHLKIYKKMDDSIFFDRLRPKILNSINLWEKTEKKLFFF